MSSTITHSEDKLYITDDLENRIDLTNLSDDGELYDAEDDKLFPPISVFNEVPNTTIQIGEHTLHGTLQSLSFGDEGWLCSITTTDPTIQVALMYAKNEPMETFVTFADGRLAMFDNIDFSVSYTNHMSIFTVTSNKARYL